VLSREAQNTNFIVFGLTEHANHCGFFTIDEMSLYADTIKQN